MLARGQPVGGNFDDARIHLFAKPGDAHHEELIHVRTEDGEEFHALEQRITFILRLFQHAPLELQQAEFAVDVQRRIVK